MCKGPLPYATLQALAGLMCELCVQPRVGHAGARAEVHQRCNRGNGGLGVRQTILLAGPLTVSLTVATSSGLPHAHMQERVVEAVQVVAEEVKEVKEDVMEVKEDVKGVVAVVGEIAAGVEAIKVHGLQVLQQQQQHAGQLLEQALLQIFEQQQLHLQRLEKQQQQLSPPPQQQHRTLRGTRCACRSCGWEGGEQ